MYREMTRVVRSSSVVERSNEMRNAFPCCYLLILSWTRMAIDHAWIVSNPSPWILGKWLGKRSFAWAETLLISIVFTLVCKSVIMVTYSMRESRKSTSWRIGEMPIHAFQKRDNVRWIQQSWGPCSTVFQTNRSLFCFARLFSLRKMRNFWKKWNEIQLEESLNFTSLSPIFWSCITSMIWKSTGQSVQCYSETKSPCFEIQSTWNSTWNPALGSFCDIPKWLKMFFIENLIRCIWNSLYWSDAKMGSSKDAMWPSYSNLRSRGSSADFV